MNDINDSEITMLFVEQQLGTLLFGSIAIFFKLTTIAKDACENCIRVWVEREPIIGLVWPIGEIIVWTLTSFESDSYYKPV